MVVKVGSGVVGHAICWFDSMSYAAQRTTNSVAEYMWLLIGLKACERRKWTPLHVVGGSNIIIHQQATRTPPRAKYLRPLFWQCLRRADQHGVMTWHHNLRVHNKIADVLANLAMDTRRGVQHELIDGASSSPRWAKIFTHADSDIGHWLQQNNQENLSGLEA